MRRIGGIAISAGLALALAACSSSTKGPTRTTGTKAPAASSAPAGSTTPATPADTGGLSGTWSGQYGGAYQGTFILDWQQSGTSLSGTIKLSSPAQTLSINGIVEGGAIRFGTVGSTAITYTGSVSGNSMSGTYKVQTGTGSVGGSWSAAKGS